MVYHRNLKLVFFVIYFLISSLFWSCDSHCLSQIPDDYVLNSFKYGEPCSPPCWHGLEVGISSQEEVISKLRELSFVDHDTIRISLSNIEGYINPKYVEFNCVFPSDCVYPGVVHCGMMFFSNETLQMISLASVTPLETIVQRLGNPDFVGVVPFGADGGWFLDVFWGDEGVVAEIFDEGHRYIDQAKSSEPISGKIKTSPLIYLSEEEMVNFMRRLSEDTIPWSGLSGD